MTLWKICCLLIVFVTSTYSAEWPAIHAGLVGMSWRSHWLEAFRKMEGIGQLAQTQRNEVLEKWALGQDHTGHEIEDHNERLIRNLGEEEYLDAIEDLRQLLESGVVSINHGYHQHPRDRRWTAGWILNSMDIIRQQPFTSTLFGVGNIENNDLIKVQALSGTFLKWNGNPGSVAEELFSGMIQPGQNAEETTTLINVISCFHGLWNQHLDQIYFLPKGKSKSPANYFQVQTFKIGDESRLDNEDLATKSGEWNTSSWGELFNKDDYAIIQISNAAATGDGLLTNILRENQALHGHQVITLQGEAHAFNPNRVFAYGKPQDNFLIMFLPEDLDSNFCLVSDVTQQASLENPLNHVLLSNPLLAHPMHSVGHPNQTTQLINKIAVSIPLAPGMSGGPILGCEIYDHQILCKRLGVMHGINLIQEDAGVSFKGLIQPPPPPSHEH